MPRENAEGRDLMDIVSLITTKEIVAHISRMKWDTAAGPDGILRKRVSKPGSQEILCMFYSLIRACGLQPSKWREHQTTLLLKEGKDPARAESYRTVTIGSLQRRMY
jgi:hypothetical protein